VLAYTQRDYILPLFSIQTLSRHLSVLVLEIMQTLSITYVQPRYLETHSTIHLKDLEQCFHLGLERLGSVRLWVRSRLGLKIRSPILVYCRLLSRIAM